MGRIGVDGEDSLGTDGTGRTGKALNRGDRPDWRPEESSLTERIRLARKGQDLTRLEGQDWGGEERRGSDLLGVDWFGLAAMDRSATRVTDGSDSSGKEPKAEAGKARNVVD